MHGVFTISPTKGLQLSPLSKDNLEAAARIYAKGLLMEEPPGSSEPLEELVESLELHLQTVLGIKEKRHVWLAMSKPLVRGLVDFYHRPTELFIRFICAIPPRQGVGTWLLQKLAQYAITHKIDLVKATVSSLDSRAQQFYFQHLNFQKTGSRLDEPGFELYLAEISSQALLKRSKKPK
jgi:hypothetical protein